MAVLAVISVLSIGSLYSQTTNMQDVVYLNNGSIIRGVIIEQVPGVSLKIRTTDGNVFVYDIKDVTKMTKEESSVMPQYGNMQNQTRYSAKSPIAAWGLSFLIPGLGQFYNGEARKGALYLGGSLLSNALILFGDEDELIYLGIIGYMVSWVGSQIDAPISANRINRERGIIAFELGEKATLGISPDFQLYNQSVAFATSKPTPTMGLKLNLSF